MANRKLHCLLDVMELNLHTPSTADNVWLVLRLLDSESFKIFLGEAINLIEVSEDDYVENDENGGMKVLRNSPEMISKYGEVCQVYSVSESSCHISCSFITSQGIKYVGFIDHPHCYEQASIQIPLSDVMIEQKALTWLSANFSSIKDQNPKRSRKMTAQQQREEALVSYLKARTFGQNSDKTVQQLYEQIQAPDKNDLWAQLQSVNPRLFATGKDDFFKAPFFKESSKEHRLSLKKVGIGRPENSSY